MSTTLRQVRVDSRAVLVATGRARVGEHDALFGTPFPLWSRGRLGGPDRPAPALLRYGSDEFMEEFLADSAGTAGGATLAPRVVTQPAAGIRKLFQPFHGEFHLVACSFLCRLPGFPDRGVQAAKEERISFVIRRLRTVGSQRIEEAWVPGSGWMRAGTATTPEPVAGEESFPLAGIQTPSGRTIHYGYLQTSSRETYGARPDEDASGAEDLAALIAARRSALLAIPASDAPGNESASLAWLRSMLTLLHDLFPEVHGAIIEKPTGSNPALATDLPTHLRTLYDRVVAENVRQRSNGSLISLRTALRCVAWTDLGDTSGLTCSVGYDATPVAASMFNLMQTTADALAGTVELPKYPAFADVRAPRFVVRCVFEHPSCPRPRVLFSEPSIEFVPAPVFDSEAPARQIRIPLPLDTDATSLRGVAKSVGFVMSRELRSRMGRIHEGMLDGDSPRPAPAFNLGAICSFSIPIITMCAMILLMIIVSLLNIVFWWLPFFRICLPINLKKP